MHHGTGKEKQNYRQLILLVVICALGVLIVCGSILNLGSDWYIPGLMPFAQCGMMLSIPAFWKEKKATIQYYKLTAVLFWIAAAMNFWAGVMQLVNAFK